MKLESACDLKTRYPSRGHVLSATNTISVRLAREISVQVGGQQPPASARLKAWGEALRDLGLPLQNLDYAQPDESQPVPRTDKSELCG